MMVVAVFTRFQSVLFNAKALYGLLSGKSGSVARGAAKCHVVTANQTEAHGMWFSGFLEAPPDGARLCASAVVLAMRGQETKNKVYLRV